MNDRESRLMPGGVPRWVRCYDNGGKTCDRYTVVFTGNYGMRLFGQRGYTVGLGMSEHPTHPQGFGQWFEATQRIDRPTYGHLGKRIPFDALPEACRRLVAADYRELWSL